jgi:hypothetical protein
MLNLGAELTYRLREFPKVLQHVHASASSPALSVWRGE